ncbi:MAG: DUF3122 domain-containing protein [Leptolyngbyaceae cyanobacterium]
MKRPASSKLRPGVSQAIVKLLVIFGLALLLMLLWSTPVALAKVQFSKEADQWIYQSQQMLTDTEGNDWEITAIKPMESDSHGVYLWLTTQANDMQLDAAQPLFVKTLSGQTFTAQNLTQQYFIGELPEPNISQYNIEPLLPKIKSETSLQLELPTKTNDSVRLLVPAEVLEEWLNVGTCEYLICGRV